MAVALLEILKAQVNPVASNIVKSIVCSTKIIQRNAGKLGSVTSELYDTPFYRGIQE